MVTYCCAFVPRRSASRASATTVTGAASPAATRRNATCWQTAPTSRSSCRTPASHVWSRINARIAVSVISTGAASATAAGFSPHGASGTPVHRRPARRPLASICRGSRCLRTMGSFSSAEYPGTSITSIRSRNAAGTVSSRFAVAMNSTSDRSTPTSA